MKEQEAVLAEYKRLAEEAKKAEVHGMYTQPLGAPCPSCGHCPTCGRGGYQVYPMVPWYPYTGPMFPYTITYTTY